MQYRVYKSLDKEHTTFGLKKTYWQYTVIGVIAAAVLGIVVGRATISLIGYVVFIIAGILVYFAMMNLQSKFTEKDLQKWMSSRQLRNFITVPPHRLSNYTIFNVTVKKKESK